MPTFAMLTRVSPESLQSPHSLEDLEQRAMAHIRKQCPQVRWIQSYAVLGPYDYLDIFTAPDVETAAKVSTLIRSFGHAHTEVWSVTEWQKFKEVLHSMAAA